MIVINLLKILKSINDAEYSEHDFMAKENLDVINVNKLFIKDKG